MPSDKDLCINCKAINVETLSAPGGFWVRRADLHRQCCLCAFIENKVFRFDRGVKEIALRLKSHFDGAVMLEMGGTEFNIGTLEDDPATRFKVPVYRRPTNTRSPETFAMAKRWIQQCASNHDCDRVFKTNVNSGIRPSRLIDVLAFGLSCLDAQLIDTRSLSRCPQYITLSYCWGPPSSHSYTTTRANFEERRRRIKYEDLPQTFRDAITITREMGERYLWADAICIIQQDEDDWEVESKTMGSIYANALVSIAAEDSKDSHGGCFRDITGPEIPDLIRLESEVSYGKTSCLLLFYDHLSFYTRNLSNIPLRKRAWAMQESILPRRILHYTASQLYWECRKVVLAEDGLPRYDVPPNAFFLRLRAFSNAFTPRDESKPITVQSSFVLWYKLVLDDYFERFLTFPEDVLPAIAGIATLIHRSLQCRYIAGIWAENIGYGLSWSMPVGFASLPQPSTYLGPSFSWVARCERKSYPRYFKSPVKLQESHVKLTGPDPFGRINGAWIRVKGRMKIAPRLPGTKRGSLPSGDRTRSNKSIVRTSIDGQLLVACFDGEHPASSMEEWCYFDLGDEKHLILVPKRDENHNGWVRVGLVEPSGEYLIGKSDGEIHTIEGWSWDDGWEEKDIIIY
ncbi:HET-domain-containing protein [Lophium mytilinum]|uniref:HET-domain-containing protein n=1 Tax=Lophium mytilinum TaxID=390894 RepID=A0A6A6QS12_9PEZI|nr:HET-domain-containing protein [Lophium mytilinum]